MMKVVKGPAEYADRFELGPMVGATQAVAGIWGAVAILHGVEGCTWEGNFIRSGGPVVDGYYLPLVETRLSQSDIVLGGNEQLIVELALKEMEKLKGRGKIIFIFTTCAASIIEDDIKRASRMLEKALGEPIPIIALDTPGFFGGFNRGAEMVWSAVLDRFGTPQGPKKGLNLLGPELMWSNNWPNDIAEMVRLLKVADVPVNHVMFRDITAEKLPELSRAEVNYVLCGEGFPDLEKKSAQLGMKVWGQDLVLPIGMHNTEEWYLTIAKEFGDVEKAKAQLQTDFQRIKKITRANYNVTHALTYMANKRCGILGYGTWVAAMARCLFYDFNMRPVVLGIWGETPKAIERAEKLLEPLDGVLDFQVLENPTFWSYSQALKEVKVDLAVGQIQDRALVESLNIPQVQLGGVYFCNQFNFVPYPYFGVLGTLNLMSQLWIPTDRVIEERESWPITTFHPRGEVGPGERKVEVEEATAR